MVPSIPKEFLNEYLIEAVIHSSQLSPTFPKVGCSLWPIFDQLGGTNYFMLWTLDNHLVELEPDSRSHQHPWNPFHINIR